MESLAPGRFDPRTTHLDTAAWGLLPTDAVNTAADVDRLLSAP
ncbi:hypothetical protein ACWCZ5_28450 [Streptomyces sp. NPDC001667]